MSSSPSVSERIRLAREKSKKRKELLESTLGSGWAEELGCEGGKRAKNVVGPENTLNNLDIDSKNQKQPLNQTHIKNDHKEGKLSNEDKPQGQIEEFRDSTAFLVSEHSICICKII